MFTSVGDLTDAINEFINVHNQDPKPFVWTVKVEDILQKVGKCEAILRDSALEFARDCFAFPLA